MSALDKYNIAVLVPCYNEATTVASVVNDFKKSLPSARIFIFDNNSTDNTYEIAKKAGAEVRHARLKGKGNVVRRMFADIDADIYVLVDGDATYDAASAPMLVHALVDQKLDMVIGARKEESVNNNNYRKGHRFGNKLLTNSVRLIFGGTFSDMLSGYRVFSKRYVKSFPAESEGFEIETELTVHALEMRVPFTEVETPYSERPEGSESKLSTYKDGYRILKMIIRLFSNERPAQFWGYIGLAFLLVSAGLMVPVLIEYASTGQVARFPTVIVATGLIIIGFLLIMVGLILRTVTKGRDESKYLAYLNFPPVGEPGNK